ncbi:MAG: cytochrome-c peroxidase [Planctomycetes bacterium]|nr:cytochrome-c peroxidase [Planctomycetota bacterium]
MAFVLQDAGRVPADTLPRELAAQPPYGLPESFAEPADNLATPERVALGRRLFFEPRLSLDGSIACATCHRPEHGLAEPEPVSTGVGGRKTARNAPTLFNRAFGAAQMWDGKGESLEHQVLMPIENELEMALALDEALRRLAADPSYVAQFERAYGSLSREHLAKALAAFVRRLTFADSPVDRFRRGEVAGLSEEERAGMWIFESSGRCWRCHSGPNFSDEGFHNTGIGVRDRAAEPGRAAITGDQADHGKFKTPTLRALAFTAPYMHDGSLATLEDVVAFYVRGGNANAELDERLQPLELSAEDQRALVAFLRALSKP